MSSRIDESGLKLIIDSIPASAWSARPDGSIDFFNEHYLDYVGLSKDQAYFWDFDAAVHPADRGALAAALQAILASAQPGETEARLRRFDGKYRWFLIRANPFRDVHGTIVKWYGVNTDIDERKRAEEALRISERNLKLIIDTIPALAWTAGPNGSAEFLNQPYLDYVGLSLQGLQGYGWTRYVHPDDLAGLLAAWNVILKSGRSGEVEARLRRADGEYRRLLFRVNPLRDDDGTILRWYGINADIEDRKRAEDRIRDTQAELAHMARIMTMGALTASIAHEINQPLSGIITNASACLRMLADDPPNVAGARETARRTIRDGNRAADVITRLRALFIRRTVAVEPVDLNEAVREVITLSRGDFQKTRLVLQTEFAEGLPLVGADRVQLQQVIINLIRNASDAMRDVEDRPRSLVIRTEPDENHRVRLTVSDVGIGLGSEDPERLFEAFYTTKSDGMGIGLSVSRSIIASHQGRLWAVRNDGPGATFCFSVPEYREDLGPVDDVGPEKTAPAKEAET